jgi:methyl-accepting chemotaxis protein
MRDYEGMVEMGQQYSDSASHIHERMEVLDQASRQISSVMTQVDESIHQINQTATDSAERIASLSRVSDAVAASMDDLNSVVRKNQEDANVLKTTIGSYQF